MGYSILKYGRLMSNVENLEAGRKEAFRFVTPAGSEFIEIRDSANKTVTIGYFDGERFHWTKDKNQTEAWKSCVFVTRTLPGPRGTLTNNA